MPEVHISSLKSNINYGVLEGTCECSLALEETLDAMLFPACVGVLGMMKLRVLSLVHFDLKVKDGVVCQLSLGLEHPVATTL